MPCTRKAPSPRSVNFGGRRTAPGRRLRLKTPCSWRRHLRDLAPAPAGPPTPPSNSSRAALTAAVFPRHQPVRREDGHPSTSSGKPAGADRLQHPRATDHEYGGSPRAGGLSHRIRLHLMSLPLPYRHGWFGGALPAKLRHDPRRRRSLYLLWYPSSSPWSPVVVGMFLCRNQDRDIYAGDSANALTPPASGLEGRRP